MYHKNSVYVTLVSVSQIHLKRENSAQRYLVVIVKKKLILIILIVIVCVKLFQYERAK